MRRLTSGDFRRHERLVPIYYSFYHYRAIRSQCLVENVTASVGVLDGKAPGAASSRKRGEIDGS